MAFATINKGSSYFNTVLYTGTGATRSITGAGFQPDWVWIKERSASASDHNLSDAVRGAGKALFSNTNGAEYDYGTGTGGNLRSFDSDGFSLGTASQTNANGTTFVSWCWDANGTGVSNTSGSITSTVSANTTSGFSIVGWTGTGSNSDQTLGTGLSTALDFVIAKPRDSGGGTDSWVVYASALNMTQNQCLLLESTSALITGATSGTPNRGSTAGQLKLLAGTVNNQNLNASGLKYIAYCFHNVKGYSKFGSYTGNGADDGTFVYTGFKPAFLMIKRTDSADGWLMFDDARNTFNPESSFLQANLSNAEGTFSYCDFTSNGFKARTSAASFNASGGTYIYMAFAENPFVLTDGTPVTAR